MDFKKHKNRLKEYLRSKGYSNFDNNISCPFHDDKNPSMKVYDEFAKCFSGCDKKDVYDFVGLFENIPEKAEQFKFIKKLYGDSNTDYGNNNYKKFKIDIESYNQVYEYIKDQINTEKGQDYIERFVRFRGYNDKFANYFGYWPGLETAQQTLSDEILQKAGIPLPKKDHKYSTWSPQGVVCKFENGFKLIYVRKNKETGKHETIKRGSHGSRTFPYPNIIDTKKIVLVEAEISAVAMRINDISSSVATGGTQGINKQDVDKLLTFEIIYICFDGDDPGKKATEKLANKLYYKAKESNNDQITIKIVNLPDNQDPDDLIKSDQIDILKKCLNEAKTYTLLEGNDGIDGDGNSNNSTDTMGSRETEHKIEESFFVENALEVNKYRSNIEEVKQLISLRKDLAAQEAARLYFVQKYETGIKLKSESINDTIWLYDEEKKHWIAQVKKINQEPMELFIQEYGAVWYIEGSKQPFIFKKTIAMRNEIERCFTEVVCANVDSENDPFQSNAIQKIISCKNCILQWNYDTNKFDEKPHDKKYNLIVAPFQFNRLDMKNLNDDQKLRVQLLRKYFSNLVSWIENKDEKYSVIQWLLSYIGYTLTSWREKCFHVWIGQPDSGKTLLKDLIALIHGNKFAEVKFAQWARHTSSHDYELLPGKLIIADDDFAVSARLPEQELKTLSQNGNITINPKHISQYSIINTATPLILTNGTPRAEDITLENRLYALPFKADFSRQKRNIDTEKFIMQIKEHETLEILFNMAIDVAEKTIFYYGNFHEFIPNTIKEMSEYVINTASSVMMWLEDMEAQEKLLIDIDNPLIKIKRTTLYNLYSLNVTGRKKGLHSFYESIRQKFKEKKFNGEVYFIGIGEKTNEYNNYYEKQESLKYKD